VLEDLGFFVIDNLPPALITNVCELASDKKKPQRGRAGASLLVRLRRWGGSGMRQRRYACDG